MLERDFLKWVVDIATRFGWKSFHVPAPMRATSKGFVGAKEAAGLPDLVLIHDDPPRLVFAELKGTGGKLSVEQRDFLQAARNVADLALAQAQALPVALEGRFNARTVGVYVWEPGMEQAIEDILRSRVLT